MCCSLWGLRESDTEQEQQHLSREAGETSAGLEGWKRQSHPSTNLQRVRGTGDSWPTMANGLINHDYA